MLKQRAPITDVFQRRHARLQEILVQQGLDGYFFNGVSDLFYLTGFKSEGFYGLFTVKGHWLFSSALLAGQVAPNAHGARLIVGKGLSKSVKEILARRRLAKVGFDGEQINYMLGAR